MTVMRDHPRQPLTVRADICGRPALEILRLVAGHLAANATVPIAALNKTPPGGIAAWVQGRAGDETGGRRPGQAGLGLLSERPSGTAVEP